MYETFSNIGIGPVIGIEELKRKAGTLHDIAERGLFVTSFITDFEHPTFVEFRAEHEKQTTNFIAVAIFVTAYHIDNYD
jgi:hypothetical protein